MREAGLTKWRILVVDDEPAVLEAHTEMLRRLGYRVATSQNPLEAFDFFKENPYELDLIMADQIMPFMRGTEMAEQIRRIRNDIPVIIITGGFDVESTQESAEALHINSVFLKPINKSDMAEGIEAILSQSRKRKRHLGEDGHGNHPCEDLPGQREEGESLCICHCR
jgi:DNA-binding NtrC family response regulator